MASAGDDAFHAAVYRLLHGAQFGNHPAGSQFGLFLLGMMDHEIDIIHERNGALLGFGQVTQKAGCAGQQDEQIGTPQAGDACWGPARLTAQALIRLGVVRPGLLCPQPLCSTCSQAQAASPPAC